jgi:hypothetical protein
MPGLTSFAAVFLVFALPLDEHETATPVTEAMERATKAFLASLTPDQRARAAFEFADAERLNWHFIPRERRGLPLKEMSEPQRTLARALLEAGIGQRGYLKARTIMELETVLRELGGNPDVRDPDLYFFSVFGTPGAGAPWGWRTEGHHLSLNFTVVNGTLVATSPAFFGANPARVQSGSRAGTRALGAEEDLARELVRSLNSEQRAVAILEAEAPRDIVTGNAAQVSPLEPAGIAVAGLNETQRAMFARLIDEYLARMADDLARARRSRLGTTDFGRVTFAWAGSVEPGEPHYYRVQGPSFLIEFDNTQNNANHVHSVWRDFEGDFGRDLLREHYRDAPHAHGHLSGTGPGR